MVVYVPSMEMFKAVLDRVWSTLVWMKMSLLMVDRLDYVTFKDFFLQGASSVQVLQ